MADFHQLISLEGKVAVVTGASKGLGAAFAPMLAQAGSDIVILCRHKKYLDETARAVHRAGRKALAIECDITRESQVQGMVKQVIGEFGKIDILINNAGTERINRAPEETSLEDWTSVMHTNVDGTFLCAREVGKVMVPRRKGKIINIASISGQVINKYFHGGSYDVSKSAVVALTKALAVEWAPYNITVLAVSPGYYDTDPNRKWFEKNPEIYSNVIDMIPLKRLGAIEELSGFIACLASDVTNYMTGSTIVIDGGYTAW